MSHLGLSGQASQSHKHHILIAIAAIVLAVLLVTFLPRAAAAGEAWKSIISDGKQEYDENCTSCHGPDGRGGGEMASKLIAPPKDLTAIATSSGGEFPFTRVFDIIAGEIEMPGHNAHQMPDFYASLKRQNYKPGYQPAHVRVLELTHYLESIQHKQVD